MPTKRLPFSCYVLPHHRSASPPFSSRVRKGIGRARNHRSSLHHAHPCHRGVAWLPIRLGVVVVVLVILPPCPIVCYSITLSLLTDLEGKTDLKIRALESILLLDAFNKDRASLPQPLPNSPPLAPIPVAALDPRTQEMINEKLKKAEDLSEQRKVDEAQKALEEAEALKKLLARQEPVVDNSNSSKYTATDVRITDQKLHVCDICGVLLSVYDRNVC
ncbi:uncharacterized protein LOC130945873 [Arachis stenosperma]|uniref:uncharacterized protein LOC130945873 n=1 Tax=Arachis stenosperma TaxID=217475 RepID=UPI0025ACF330|nr:uncharacterized protein LOC130945873 [Arachis stenosperma]